MNRKLTYMLLLLTVVAIMGVPQAAALSSYLNNFNTTYPSAVGTRIDTCILCHQGDPRIGGSTDRNLYGAAFGSNNHNFATIEPLDSDGDGFSNIDEIHNLTFPGNVSDFPPKIVSFSPTTPVSDTGTPATRTFSIVANQVVATITWILDGNVQKTEISVSASNFAVTTSVAALHNVTAVAQKAGDGSAMQTWDWNVTTVAPPETGTIAGIVTNASSNLPISGATVKADGKTATTDASGNYSITIAPGTYNVTAGAAGYENITVTDVIVTANTTNAQDFALTPTIIIPGTGTIAGKVTNASSNSPIVGATVTADGKTATTDNTGNYSITIAPGNYTVTANATGYEDKAASVVVMANETTTQDLALTPKVQVETGTIAGKVTDASSNSPIAGATVKADNKTATTDTSGNYSITVVLGTYTVTASAAGYQSSVPASVVVMANKTTTQNFALTKIVTNETGTIAGMVTNASSGLPIAGATVTADSKMATTDASGNYSITIAPGTYTVTASAAGYEDKTVTGVAVAPNTTTTVNFALTKPVPTENGSISGRVVDVATGMGIPNVEIRLVGIVGMGMDTRSIKMETTTDSTGMWEFNNLPAGRYIIIEKLPKGYIPITSPVMNIMLEQGEDSMNNDFEVKPISALLPPMQV